MIAEGTVRTAAYRYIADEYQHDHDAILTKHRESLAAIQTMAVHSMLWLMYAKLGSR